MTRDPPIKKQVNGEAGGHDCNPEPLPPPALDRGPLMAGFNDKIEAWSKVNRFYSGGSADLLSLIPFVALVLLLYLVGREILMAPKPAERDALH